MAAVAGNGAVSGPVGPTVAARAALPVVRIRIDDAPTERDVIGRRPGRQAPKDRHGPVHPAVRARRAPRVSQLGVRRELQVHVVIVRRSVHDPVATRAQHDHGRGSVASNTVLDVDIQPVQPESPENSTERPSASQSSIRRRGSWRSLRPRTGRPKCGRRRRHGCGVRSPGYCRRTPNFLPW